MRATASLFLVLAVAKACGLAGRPLPDALLAPIALLGPDALVALCFGLFAAAVRRRAVVLPVYALLAGLAIVNVPVVRAVATPITVPMLRAAGGALLDSIVLYATPVNLALLALATAAALAAPRLFRRRAAARVAFAVVLAVAAAGPFALRGIASEGRERTPLLALLASARPRVAAAAAVGEAARDWREPIRPSPAAPDLRSLRGAAAGRDVLLVVLESCGAVYLPAWGGAEGPDPMPNLARLAGEGMLVTDAYTLYPESVKGLLGLLASFAPGIDTAVERYAGLRRPTLADAFRAAGYRTVLVHSGRFDYLGMRGIVEGRGFDRLLDAADLTGERRSSFGADEEVAVDRMLALADGLAEAERLFLVYMPIAGHHPYDAPVPGPFPSRDLAGAYRNALHYGDRELGRLVEGLRARGRDPLLAVVGDHGQAFEQHPGNVGHTFFLYEENVRVPLAFVARGAIPPGTRVHRVGSHLDVAPTLLDLAGVPAPETFEGSSLLDPAPRVALFFTDYSLALLGLRDGPLKAIHDVASNSTRVYDLAADPGETRDLGASHGDFAREARERLLAWAAAQRAHLVGE